MGNIMGFRYDLNGLRAIAVIAVVLFHFNVNFISGGFAGVDVFFVTSGFLMTSIIFRGLENNSFNTFKFYVARANRIIPALVVVCIILLILGWSILGPTDYKALGKHVASSVGFLSNIIYWRESGYFDTSSQSKWLLHTWSLSVEWQFYIIYPVVLVIAKRFLSFANLKRLLVVGTVIGLVGCVYATIKWPNPAYYLLPTRAWEMMFGGLAYLYPVNFKATNKKLVEYLGLTLILASYLFVSKSDPWPGSLALIPVLGAFLVILANRQNSIFTNNHIFQFIGKSSYSIYLWHWPIVVLGYYFEIDNWIYIGIPLSIFLGWLNYRFVEQYKFKSFTSWSKLLFVKPVWLVLIVGILGSAVFLSNGAFFHYPQDIQKMDYSLKYPKYCHVDSSTVKPEINCTIGEGNTLGLIWGDSYAGVLDPFVKNILNNRKTFISRTTSHCFPSFNTDFMLGDMPEYCSLIRKTNLKEVKNKKFKVIFLAARWESMYENYGELGFKSVMDTVDFASKNALEVYFFAQPVYYEKNIKRTTIKNMMLNKKSNFKRNDRLPQELNKRFKDAIKNGNYPNVHFIDRSILYAQDIDYTSDGTPYTVDKGHLSESGSIQASKHFILSSEFIPLKYLIDLQ